MVAASAPDRGTPRTVDIECEQCGHAFQMDAPRRRKVPCPQCGSMTLVPFQRAPVWFLAIAGASLGAIVVPGLSYRWFGPTIALPVACVTLGALWWLGRRM